MARKSFLLVEPARRSDTAIVRVQLPNDKTLRERQRREKAPRFEARSAKIIAITCDMHMLKTLGSDSVIC